MQIRHLLFYFPLFFAGKILLAATEPDANASAVSPEQVSPAQLMKAIHQRIDKFDWDQSLFPAGPWRFHGRSVAGQPLLYYTCGDPQASNRSLILSAVHGDELTPIYYGFRLVEWLKARPEVCRDKFIVVAPLVNPDGFLRYQSGTRTNYNKVDLNRNFATPEWLASAQKLWQQKYRAQRRYYPGDKPDSEPETLFQKWLIAEFKPNKILSIHAPLNFLDYDGPKSELETEFTAAYLQSCKELKMMMMRNTPDLRFHAYGTFPGSLGNYAGKWLGIPTLTLELPSTRAQKAAKYFALLEEASRQFLEFSVQGQPLGLEKKIASGMNFHEAATGPKSQEATSHHHQ